MFQSTPPARAATTLCLRTTDAESVSIHAARAGGDSSAPCRNSGASEFQSTPPARAATRRLRYPAPRGSVSIHAARAGGDSGTSSHQVAPSSFQSTPPARAATQSRLRSVRPWGFQSTPPARAATTAPIGHRTQPRGFNPRRPRGRRLPCHGVPVRHTLVSIHAARAGGDSDLLLTRIEQVVSIHAARAGGDRRRSRPLRSRSRVSIHAARAGGDSTKASAQPRASSFNPRRPRGRRRSPEVNSRQRVWFQSTPPARAATPANAQQTSPGGVSIHAARAGGD